MAADERLGTGVYGSKNGAITRLKCHDLRLHLFHIWGLDSGIIFDYRYATTKKQYQTL